MPAGQVGAGLVGGAEDRGVEEVAVGVDGDAGASWRRVIDDNLTSPRWSAARPSPRSPTAARSCCSARSTAGTAATSCPVRAYAAANAGIIGLTRHLARHLAKHQARRRIRGHCLAPGPVSTPMLDRLTADELAALRATIPLDHLTTAAEIAEPVGRLCSPAAASVTGAVIDVNGGMWMG